MPGGWEPVAISLRPAPGPQLPQHTGSVHLALSQLQGLFPPAAIPGWMPCPRGQGYSALPGTLPAVQGVAGVCPRGIKGHQWSGQTGEDEIRRPMVGMAFACPRGS